jgi:hypothetical protein
MTALVEVIIVPSALVEVSVEDGGSTDVMTPPAMLVEVAPVGDQGPPGPAIDIAALPPAL